MSGKVRDFFPGGNTPKGFYSYYQYICGQKEAESIICIKGGPGTGKSTFMKSIAEHFMNKGETVDRFWCSSDPDSLDAVLLRERHVAFMDGTSPHIMDPVNPGAVDIILNLGEYWDNINLKRNKTDILESNRKIKRWFSCAYKNLEAAASLRTMIREIYDEATHEGELYKKVSSIINDELKEKPVTISQGMCRKYFASAITYKGNLTHMKSLVSDYKKLYMIYVPVGFDTKKIMHVISDAFIHRGCSIEQYYCPMDPENTVDHILIPEMEVGFVTMNDYHDMEAWECNADIISIDMREYIDWNYIEKYSNAISLSESDSSSLIEHAIGYLGMAKHEHDILEGYYVPCMNFEKIKHITDEWICKIERKEL